MKDSKIFAYIGFISALVTIIDCVIRTIKATKFTISPISMIGLVIFAITIIIYFIVKDDIVYYNTKKVFCYFLRNKDSYFVENKECIYTYITRTEMEYTKNMK